MSIEEAVEVPPLDDATVAAYTKLRSAFLKATHEDCDPVTAFRIAWNAALAHARERDAALVKRSDAMSTEQSSIEEAVEALWARWRGAGTESLGEVARALVLAGRALRHVRHEPPDCYACQEAEQMRTKALAAIEALRT